MRADSPLTAAATGGLAAGVAAGIAATRMNDQLHAPQPRAAEPAYTGYVPYSDIYGSARSTGPQTTFSPQPHSMNQVSPPRRGTPSDYSDRLYPDDRHSRAYDGTYDDRYNDRYQGRRDPRARSYDSYDSRDDYRRGRRDDDYADRRERGKSSSGLSGTFDGSQRGLGYGAVGAIAGGLVGSGVGKGPVPATIGAVLGGLGANMFEARERQVKTKRSKTTVERCATITS